MQRRLWSLALALVSGAFLACGGEIDSADVTKADVLDKQPAKFRDGGDLVTGTVVKRTKDGQVLEETEYVDGFPNGSMKEWYANGQPKSERVVKYQDGGQYGGRLQPVGAVKFWCENGTLESESESDEDGNPVGVSQTFTCDGEPLSYVTNPFGPRKSWTQWQGEKKTRLTEEATTAEGGGYVGERKTYFAENGKPAEVQFWKDGKLDGEYKRFAATGELEEGGTYQAGQRVGVWTRSLNGYQNLYDYDLSHFIDPEYAAPFAQAAGIDLSGSGAAMTPLREYKVDLEKVKYYVSKGLVDPKKKLWIGQVPPDTKDFAIAFWSYPYVRASKGALDTLAQLGADPKAVDSENRSRLFYCIYSLADPNQCSAAELKRLIDLGLDVKQADVEGDTPLHALLVSTSYYGRQLSDADSAAVMQVLLAAGADVDAQNRKGLSPLMVAVQQKRFPIAAMLLDKSQKPGLATKEGYNLVHLAFISPDMSQFMLDLSEPVKSFVELAVKKGVDPSAPVGDQGGTLKEIAEKSGAIELAQYLAGLKKG
jgi:antitoxin component YwqK of YwqJK toxin-antitoxin module